MVATGVTRTFIESLLRARNVIVVIVIGIPNLITRTTATITKANGRIAIETENISTAFMNIPTIHRATDIAIAVDPTFQEHRMILVDWLIVVHVAV